MSGPVFTASESTRRERAATKHDGLCIVQMPELSTCRCNCPRCWSKHFGAPICEEERPIVRGRSAGGKNG